MTKNHSICFGGIAGILILLALLLVRPRSAESVPAEVAVAHRLLRPQPKADGQVLVEPPLPPQARAFRDWVTRTTAFQGDLPPSELREGETLALEHRREIGTLIGDNPKLALSCALPMRLRQMLPPTVVENLEERINAVGDFEVFGTLGGDTPPIQRFVRIGEKRYLASVFGKRIRQPSTPGDLLAGIAVGDRLALDEFPFRVLETGEVPDPDRRISQLPLNNDRLQPEIHSAPDHDSNSFLVEAGGQLFRTCCPLALAEFEGEQFAAEGGTGGPVYPFTQVAVSSGTGVRSILFIRLSFPDSRRELESEVDAYKLMAEVGSWYAKSSYGQVSFLPVVTPLLVLPRPEAWYSAHGGESALKSDALAQVLEFGFEHTSFDHVVFAYKGGPGSFSGFASIGGQHLWLKNHSSRVLGHELGHNFGLWHANFWNTSGKSVIGPGSAEEYGNSYDLMGGASPPLGHFNAAWKARLGWLPDRFVHTVVESGVYRIGSFDNGVIDPNLRSALRVRKDENRSYWGEFRTLFPQASTQNGLLLNWNPFGASSGTALLDTTPASAFGKDDAALVIGRTLSDPAAGIHITPLQREPSVPGSIDVAVNVGSFVGNQPPAINLISETLTAAPGQEILFTATAQDPDGDPLAYYWSDGQSQFNSENSPTISMSWQSPGNYVVRCLVSDMKGQVSSDSVVVTVGTPTELSVSGGVTVAGQPLGNVHITNGGTGSNYRGAYTDSDGQYMITGLSSGSLSLQAVLPGYSILPTFSDPIFLTEDFQAANFSADEDISVSISVSDPTATEGGDTASLTLTRSGPVTSPLKVIVSSTSGTVGGADFLISPTTYFDISTFMLAIDIPAGMSSIQIVFQALPDEIVEGPETWTMELGSSADYSIIGTSSGTVTALDNNGNGLPSISVTAEKPDSSESGPSGEFLIRCGTPAESDLDVSFAVSGTAINGVDYMFIENSLVLAEGESSFRIPIPAIDDAEVEGLENVILTILPSADYNVSSEAGDATVFITDDDIPTLSITADDGSASESGPDPATLVVTRTGDTGLPLTVGYAIAGTAHHGVDYAVLPGVLEIPAGSSSASITIVPVDDEIGEPSQSVTIQLRASTDYAVGEAYAATATITDNDVPVVTIGATDGTAAEPSDTAQLKITTRGSGSGTITVNYTVTGTATPGADYTALSGSVSMGRNTTSTITISPQDDGLPEDLETITISIDPDPNYTTFLDDSATVNLIDDEQPAVSAYPHNGTLSEQSSSSLGYYLQRTGSTSGSLTVHYAMSGTATNGTDYQLMTGTASIPSGKSDVLVTTPITPDTEAEGTESATLTIVPDASYGLGMTTATRYIPDDDTPGEIVGFTTTTATGGEDSGLVTLPISLSASAAAPVTVEYAIAGGSATGGVDYELISGLLTFDPGETIKEIPLTILDDIFDEPDQTVLVELRNAWGAAMGTSTFTYTIVDNDNPPAPTVGFAATTSNLPEGAPPGVLVSLSSAQQSTVTVDVAVSGGSATSGEDYLLLPGALTFAPGETIRSLPLTISADLPADPGETIEFTLSAPTGAALGPNATHLASITDVPFVELDSDEDGLPDSWELEYGFDPFDDGSGLEINGPYGDGDGDSMNNLIEHALAKNPNLPDGPAAETSIVVDPIDDKRYLTILYTRRSFLPFHSIDFEETGDLLNWNSDPVNFVERSVLPNADGVSEAVTVRVIPSLEDIPDQARLIRIAVTATPSP